MKSKPLIGLLGIINLITLSIIVILVANQKSASPDSPELLLVQQSPDLMKSQQLVPTDLRPIVKEVMQNIDPLYERVITGYLTKVAKRPPYWGKSGIYSVYAKDGRYEEAIKACQGVQEYDRNNLDNLYTLAWINTAMERYPDAELLCNQCLEIVPGFARAAVLKGWIYFCRGDQEKALEVCQKAAQDNPDAPGPLYGIGRIYAIKGDYSKAIEAYLKAVRLKPDAAELFFHLAIVYHQAGRDLEARQSLRKAIDANVQYAEAYFLTGILLDKIGQHFQAAAEFQNAVIHQPVFPEAHLFLGIQSLRTGAYEAASMKFMQTQAMKPDFAEAYVGLGLTYLLMNQVDDARLQQKRLAEMDTAKAEALDRIIQQANL